MIEIIPAILPKNYEDLKNKISLVRGVMPLVQIDICDGNFVPNLTWPFFAKGKDDFDNNDLDKHFLAILNEREGLPFWEDIDFELDLMTTDAISNFDIYAKLGPKRIIFHYDSVENKTELLEFLEGMDSYTKDVFEIGLAFNNSHNLDTIEQFLSNVDFVQFMGIDNIGFQGESFNEDILEKIKNLKSKHPDVLVSVDGGVDLAVAYLLKEAGVDRVVSGSYIFNSDDIISRIEDLQNL